MSGWRQIFPWLALPDLLALFVVLFAAWPRRGGGGGDAGPRVLGLPRCIAAGAAAGAAFLAKLLFLPPVGLFGLLGLVWMHLAVVLPAGALAVLVLPPLLGRRGTGPFALRSTGAARVLAVLVLAGGAAGVWASHVEPYRLRVDRVEMPLDVARAGSQAIRVGVLSDLQTARVGAFEHRVVDALMAERPDVIVMPGDVYQDWPYEPEAHVAEFRELFARLDAPGGVYLVEGDVDRIDILERMIEGTRVRLLVNETATVTLRDRTVTVLGLEQSFESAAARSAVRALEAAPGDDVRLVVAHRPEAVMALAHHSRVDLVVAGHTHGGQVCVPFYGPPITLCGLPRRIAAGGLHEFHDNALFISRGVGLEQFPAPRIRFLCPPEVNVLTLGRPAAVPLAAAPANAASVPGN